MKFIQSILTLFVLSFFACNDAEKPAPYSSASTSFKIESLEVLPSSKKINFELDSFYIKAKFNEKVSWEITILGDNSRGFRAEKKIIGTGDSIGITNSVWDGASDNIYFFRKNEKVEISLKVIGSDSITKMEGFTITAAKTFKNSDRLRKVIDCEPDKERVVDEEKRQDSVRFPINALADNNTVNIYFDDSGTNEEVDKIKFASVSPTSGLKIEPIQGVGLLYVEGQDDPGASDPFFIGGINSEIAFGLKSYPLDKIFLNFYVNTLGNTTTKIVIELDGLGGDRFKSEKIINFTGWRLISIKLSDFILGNVGGLGNGAMKPEALKKIFFGLHSGNGPGKKAQFALDFVTFTYDKPFSQAD